MKTKLSKKTVIKYAVLIILSVFFCTADFLLTAVNVSDADSWEMISVVFALVCAFACLGVIFFVITKKVIFSAFLQISISAVFVIVKILYAYVYSETYSIYRHRHINFYEGVRDAWGNMLLFGVIAFGFGLLLAKVFHLAFGNKGVRSADAPRKERKKLKERLVGFWSKHKLKLVCIACAVTLLSGIFAVRSFAMSGFEARMGHITDVKTHDCCVAYNSEVDELVGVLHPSYADNIGENIDMTVTFNKGKITVTDNTNNKTYTGRYKPKYVWSFSAWEYDLEIEGMKGNARAERYPYANGECFINIYLFENIEDIESWKYRIELYG